MTRDLEDLAPAPSPTTHSRLPGWARHQVPTQTQAQHQPVPIRPPGTSLGHPRPAMSAAPFAGRAAYPSPQQPPPAWPQPPHMVSNVPGAVPGAAYNLAAAAGARQAAPAQMQQQVWAFPGHEQHRSAMHMPQPGLQQVLPAGQLQPPSRPGSCVIPQIDGAGDDDDDDGMEEEEEEERKDEVGTRKMTATRSGAGTSVQAMPGATAAAPAAGVSHMSRGVRAEGRNTAGPTPRGHLLLPGMPRKPPATSGVHRPFTMPLKQHAQGAGPAAVPPHGPATAATATSVVPLAAQQHTGAPGSFAGALAVEQAQLGTRGGGQGMPRVCAGIFRPLPLARSTPPGPSGSSPAAAPHSAIGSREAAAAAAAGTLAHKARGQAHGAGSLTAAPAPGPGSTPAAAVGSRRKDMKPDLPHSSTSTRRRSGAAEPTAAKLQLTRTDRAKSRPEDVAGAGEGQPAARAASTRKGRPVSKRAMAMVAEAIAQEEGQADARKAKKARPGRKAGAQPAQAAAHTEDAQLGHEAAVPADPFAAPAVVQSAVQGGSGPVSGYQPPAVPDPSTLAPPLDTLTAERNSSHPAAAGAQPGSQARAHTLRRRKLAAAAGPPAAPAAPPGAAHVTAMTSPNPSPTASGAAAPAQQAVLPATGPAGNLKEYGCGHVTKPEGSQKAPTPAPPPPALPVQPPSSQQQVFLGAAGSLPQHATPLLPHAAAPADDATPLPLSTHQPPQQQPTQQPSASQHGVPGPMVPHATQQCTPGSGVQPGSSGWVDPESLPCFPLTTGTPLPDPPLPSSQPVPMPVHVPMNHGPAIPHDVGPSTGTHTQAGEMHGAPVAAPSASPPAAGHEPEAHSPSRHMTVAVASPIPSPAHAMSLRAPLATPTALAAAAATSAETPASSGATPTAAFPTQHHSPPSAPSVQQPARSSVLAMEGEEAEVAAGSLVLQHNIQQGTASQGQAWPHTGAAAPAVGLPPCPVLHNPTPQAMTHVRSPNQVADTSIAMHNAGGGYGGVTGAHGLPGALPPQLPQHHALTQASTPAARATQASTPAAMQAPRQLTVSPLFYGHRGTNSAGSWEGGDGDEEMGAADLPPTQLLTAEAGIQAENRNTGELQKSDAAGPQEEAGITAGGGGRSGDGDRDGDSDGVHDEPPAPAATPAGGALRPLPEQVPVHVEGVLGGAGPLELLVEADAEMGTDQEGLAGMAVGPASVAPLLSALATPSSATAIATATTTATATATAAPSGTTVTAAGSAPSALLHPPVVAADTAPHAPPDQVMLEGGLRGDTGAATAPAVTVPKEGAAPGPAGAAEHLFPWQELAAASTPLLHHRHGQAALAHAPLGPPGSQLDGAAAEGLGGPNTLHTPHTWCVPETVVGTAAGRAGGGGERPGPTPIPLRLPLGHQQVDTPLEFSLGRQAAGLDLQHPQPVAVPMPASPEVCGSPVCSQPAQGHEVLTACLPSNPSDAQPASEQHLPHAPSQHMHGPNDSRACNQDVESGHTGAEIAAEGSLPRSQEAMADGQAQDPAPATAPGPQSIPEAVQRPLPPAPMMLQQGLLLPAQPSGQLPGSCAPRAGLASLRPRVRPPTAAQVAASWHVYGLEACVHQVCVVEG